MHEISGQAASGWTQRDAVRRDGQRETVCCLLWVPDPEGAEPIGVTQGGPRLAARSLSPAYRTRPILIVACWITGSRRQSCEDWPGLMPDGSRLSPNVRASTQRPGAGQHAGLPAPDTKTGARRTSRPRVAHETAANRGNQCWRRAYRPGDYSVWKRASLPRQAGQAGSTRRLPYNYDPDHVSWLAR